VNATNPAERYVTLTDTLGEWTSTFEPAAIEDPGDLPRTFALSQNYPNPFNPSTIIPFHVGRVGIVRLSVYTVLGQLLDVREVDLVAGDYQIEWSAREPPACCSTRWRSAESGSHEKWSSSTAARGRTWGGGFPFALPGARKDSPG